MAYGKLLTLKKDFLSGGSPKLDTIIQVFFMIILGGYFFFNTEMHRSVFYLSIPFFLVFIAREKRQSLYSSGRQVWNLLAIFLAYNFISTFWTSDWQVPDVLQSMKLLIFIPLFLWALYIFLIKNTQSIYTLPATYIISAIISGIWIVFINFDQIVDMIAADTSYRLNGLGRGGNPNQCAVLFGVAIIFYSFVRIDRASKLFTFLLKPWMKYSAISLFTLIILLTASRGGMLALAGTLVAIYFIKGSRERALKLTIAGLFLFSFFIFSPYDFSSIKSRGDNYRFNIWEQAWEEFKSEPILGHGIATELQYELKDTEKIETSTHDIYLGAAVYGGVVGFILFLGVAFTGLVQGFKAARSSGDYGFLAMLVYGGIFFLTSGHTLYLNLNVEWLLSFIPLAFIMAILYHANASSEKVEG